jgi:hypothetical protein
MRITKFLIPALAATLLFSVGCKKTYLDTAPTDSITDESLFETTTSAYTVLDGINRMMSERFAALTEQANKSENDWGAKTMDLTSDIMGNDVVCNPINFEWFTDQYQYQGQLRANYRVVFLGWSFYYKIINQANIIIANVDRTVGPQAEKDDLKGEAYAYRAWAYYSLTQFYCKTYKGNEGTPGVPIYTTPSTSTIAGAPRGTVGANYDLMVADLKQAVTLLTTGTSHANKSFISLAVAQGIYARVALVMNDWTTASTMATSAIGNSGAQLMDSATYRAGFNTNTNVEFMWASALSPGQTQDFGNKSFFSFVDAAAPSSYAGAGTWRKITKKLQDTIPATDVRKLTFASDRKQTKFRLAGTQYTWDVLYMRLAEMYLISAEAKAHLADASAVTDLETLVKKRNPGYTFAGSSYTEGSNLLAEIYLQRRIELWLEGFGYTDIQRLKQPLARPSGTGNHTVQNALILNLPAGSDQFLFKIPQAELDANDNIGPSDQNPG